MRLSGPKLALVVAAIAYVILSPSVTRADPSSNGATKILFSAAERTIGVGETVQLEWYSPNSKYCVASGAWEGTLNPSGAIETVPLKNVGTYEYWLQCFSAFGDKRKIVTVEVVAGDPSIQLAVQPAEVEYLGDATLSWQAFQVGECLASGAWSGEMPSAGTLSLQGVTQSATYELECSTLTDPIRAEVTLTVLDGGPPGTGPTVRISVSASEIEKGDAVTVSWSSEGASNCTADGDWDGAVATGGSELIENVQHNSTFGIRCSSDDGSTAVASANVSVLGITTLVWSPPEANSDGSEILPLSGYRVYYGEQSRDYDAIESVDGAATTQYSLKLPQGSYYFALTAVSESGLESGFSNEVQRTIE